MRKRISEHIIPEIENWPLKKLSDRKDAFVDEMTKSTLDKIVKKHFDKLPELLATTAYLEKRRVKTNSLKVDPPNEYEYWNKIEHKLKKLNNNNGQESIDEYKKILQQIVNRYAAEIFSGFNPSTFRFITITLTAIFKRFFDKFISDSAGWFWGNRESLLRKIKVKGSIDYIRSLMKHGTVVVVPTHFSNMDSILIGYGLDGAVGMPSFSYGAGLNLYDIEILGYFMNRVGAYKVDRRKKNAIYLETLKGFSSLTVQQGVNTLFFPGGGRARSGQLEKKLKLGLLGTLHEAQRIAYVKKNNHKVFVFPLVVSYHSVLDAKHLVEDQLRFEGKERYLKSRIKKFGFREYFRFVKKIFTTNSEVIINIAPPMDVFGNEVTMEGLSLDKKGKELNLSEYYEIHDTLTTNPQRENVYTKVLGEKIVESFHKHNYVLSSHIVSFAAYRFLLNNTRNRDNITAVLTPLDEFVMTMDEMTDLVSKILNILHEKESNKELLIDPAIKKLSILELIREGIYYLAGYHMNVPLVELDNGEIRSQDLKLLYFYHNRLIGYEIEESLAN